MSESTDRSTSKPHTAASSAAGLFGVLLVLATMLVTALSLVYRFGTSILPQADELWALYDAGPGIQFSWLWQTWAEHRIPLAKLLWKAVLDWTNYDFRAGNFLTVLLLAAVAAAAILTARKLRGRTLLIDAFFPLALLNFGQAQVFLWWWQVNHVLAPAVAALLLSLIVLRGNDRRPGDLALIGAGMILLVLCGPGGLPYVIALAAWLGLRVSAWWPDLDPPQRKLNLAMSIPAVAALALVGLYFINYTPYFPVNDPPSISTWPPSPGFVASMPASLQILGVSLGTATKPYATVFGFGVLALGVITVGALIQTWRRRPGERLRAAGLLAFLSAVAVLAIVIGRSRAGMGLDYIYQGHYLPLIAPGLCCVYFAWEIHGGAFARSIQLAMLAVLVVLLPANFRQAVQAGESIERQAMAFERDVRKGLPASVLAERHFASDVVPRADRIATILRAHKENRVGIFADIREDPSSRTEVLDIETATLDKVTLHDGLLASTADSDGTGSLTFILGQSRHVYAIRLRYAYNKTANPWPTLRAYWRNGTTRDFGDDAAFSSTVAGPDQPTWALVDGKIQTNARVRTERTLTIWIDEQIDRFRIYPDSAPCEFRLSRIELLVPAD